MPIETISADLITPRNRRTLKAPVNPLDKSTVVSIFPQEVFEVKHTIQPGQFHIPAGSYKNPSVLVVGPSSWWAEINEDQPLVEVPTSSIGIADAIVKDYCNGILAVGSGTGPGLFYLPGEQTSDSVKKSFSSELEKANQRQIRWFQALITLADSLWSRSNGNPLAIDEHMRMAARELGQQGIKDWMKSHAMVEMVRCVACGSLKNPTFPVCQVCRAISDPAKAKELGIQFAS